MDNTPAARFKFLREYLNQTQKEFAESLGMKQTYISAIEKGKRDISNNILQKLFELYEVSSDWLKYNKGNFYVRNGNTIHITDRDNFSNNTGKRIHFEKDERSWEDYVTMGFTVSKETEIRAKAERQFEKRFEKEIKERRPDLDEIEHIMLDFHTYVGDVHYIMQKYFRKAHKFDLHYFREQNLQNIDYEDYFNKKTKILESYLKYKEMMLKLLPAVHEFYTLFKQMDTTGFGEDLEDELPLSFKPNI